MVPSRTSRTVALSFALATGSCGARTALSVPEPDASLPADAGPSTCAQRLAAATAGSVAWTFPFATPAAGPVAADPSGATYFVALDPTATGRGITYTVLSLDACGALRWQSQPVHSPTVNGMRPSAMVTGDQLIVQTVNLDAFDLATGAHRWSADLAAFGSTAGLGDVLTAEDGAAGPATATADGTLFLPFATSSQYLLQVDRTGAVSLFSRGAQQLERPALSLVTDAAGHLDLLLNTTLHGAEAVSFDRAGAVRFMASFACTQSFIGPLASGRSFIAQQSGLCGLDFNGRSRFDTHSQTQGAIVVDSDDNLYFSLNQSFGSADVSGHARWTRPLAGAPWSSVVLGERNVFAMVLANDTSFHFAVTALARTDGATAWSTSLESYHLDQRAPANPFEADTMLLVAPGVLVVGGANQALGIATGAELLDARAPWPTPRGGADQRAAATGQ